MTIREARRLARIKEKAELKEIYARENVPNPNHKPGPNSFSDMYKGIDRTKKYIDPRLT
jgi:hypothetical protein